MSKLTATQKELSRGWLHDLFCAGGVITPTRPSSPRYYWMYNSGNSAIESSCDRICKEIIGRPGNLNQLDSAFDYLAGQVWLPDPKVSTGQAIKKPATILAKFVADFCSEHQIYWDDSNKTQYEKDAYASSYLGAALYEYKCFLSQQSTASKPARTTKSTNGTSTNGGQPISNYKQSGPHSQDIPNLAGTSGSKEQLPYQYMCCIIADKIGQNVPGAYITPLQVVGNKINQVSKATAEHIKFGSGNGYTDCKLWFASTADATPVLQHCEQKYGNKYTNFRLAKAKTDPNGYYYVSTEVGYAYIQANKLNEELDEALANRPVSRFGELDSEAYFRYDI